MILDNQATFSLNQTLTATAASTNLIDLAGTGSGNPPSGSFGTATVFGADMGVGRGIRVGCIVGTALTGGTSLNVQFQGAPDNGSNAPGSYTTFAETGAIPAASLTAGARIGTFDVPRALPDGSLVRFVRLNYTIVGPFTGGNIAWAGIVLDADEWMGKFYPSGFTVQ